MVCYILQVRRVIGSLGIENEQSEVTGKHQQTFARG